MSEQKATYFSRILSKYGDKFIEKWGDKTNTSETEEERDFDFQMLFTYALIDSVNDIEARLQKLERESRVRSCSNRPKVPQHIH